MEKQMEMSMANQIQTRFLWGISNSNSISVGDFSDCLSNLWHERNTNILVLGSF